MLDKIIKDLEKLQSISNVDEESAYFNAIQIIKQHGLQHHTITDTEIGRMAKEYAENENSAYTNDYYGFIAGAKAVLSMMPQSEGWVKVEDRLPKDFTSVLVSDGNTRTTALYQNDFFYPDFLLEHSEVKYWMPLPTTPNQ